MRRERGGGRVFPVAVVPNVAQQVFCGLIRGQVGEVLSYKVFADLPGKHCGADALARPRASSGSGRALTVTVQTKAGAALDAIC